MYALKRVKMNKLNEKEQENALNEVRILASIRNPAVVGYKEAFFEEKSNSLWYHANNQYCYGVLRWIRFVPKDCRPKKEGQILCRERNMESNDKPVTRARVAALYEHTTPRFEGNVLMNQSANVFMSTTGQVKLGDMNVSKLAKRGLLYTQTGTPYYASPEVWKDMPYDQKSDIWSLGCVIYEMATLKPPFRAEDKEGLFRKVQAGNYKPIPSFYSQGLSYVLDKMLQVNPQN